MSQLSSISLELAVAITGLVILLADLWTPAEHKRKLGYAGAAALLFILLASTSFKLPVMLFGHAGEALQPVTAFNGMFVADELSLYFKQFFLVAGICVLFMATEFSSRIASGISEYYALILFALTGMMFAASANDFVLVFVALELITITFYVLTSFQRNRLAALEAGIKYLILGGLSSAFMVFGIALVFGTAGTTNFGKIHALLAADPMLGTQKLFLLGLLMVLTGLGFKIAAFPFQIWAPDVYQGAPAPTTAFLAVGSKAAGIVLLLRMFFVAVPEVVAQWSNLLIVVAAITILYGNLCAIPQRSLKRLLAYSSISNAGYLLLGFAALSAAGVQAVLYYLAGYLFTVLAAFTVITVVARDADSDDITAFAGLGRRSPLLATALTMAMVSLAGIPPLAGFFGKFLLLKAVLEQGAVNPGYYCLLGVVLVGVVISLYYYFGVIRAIYWAKDVTDFTSIPVGGPTRAILAICIAGMLYLGLLPEAPMRQTEAVTSVLTIRSPGAPVQTAEAPAASGHH